MRLGIVHLSDIHFLPPPKQNPLVQRQQQIAEAIHRELTRNNIVHCLIIISGDIAYSGKAEEYDVANKFLEEVSTRLKKLNAEYAPSWFFVPGNHDCDFSLENGIRRSCVQSVAAGSSVDQSQIDAGVSIQANYRQFTSRWQDGGSCPGNSLVNTASLSFAGRNIYIYGVNSAWLSQQEEKIGKLIFPISFLPQLPSNDEYSLTICIMHHTYAWFETSNSKLLRTKLESLGDLIFTGHEHETDVYAKTNRHGGDVVFFEGGVLQDSKSPGYSSFNFVMVDCDSKNAEFYFNESTSLSDNYISKRIFETPFLRNHSRLRNTYQIATSFLEFLTEPGAPYTHRIKERLRLEHIFVCPDLREFDAKNISEQGRNIPGSSLNEYVQTSKQVLVLGGDLSGKTTFGKHIFQELYRHGIVPVYVNGRDFSSRDGDSAYKLLCEKFLQQYRSPELSAYEALPKTKRAIIIDDYHRIKFNGQVKAGLIERLISVADIVVILGLAEFCLEEILNHNKETSILLRFEHTCELCELTPVQREKMVNQWYQAGADDALEPSQAYDIAVHPTARRINEVLQRDFMPAYPFVILTLLNQIETFSKLDTKQASLGFLYEVLVKIRLSAGNQDLVDADTQYTYLSELAYCMFKKKSFKLSKGEIELWHKWYLKEMKEKIVFENIIKSLIDAQLICFSNGDYFFKYRMHYFFFAGRYFASNLTESKEIQRLVSLMTRRLHNEDAANIVMFICYFAKDSYALNCVLESAKSIFASSKPFDLDKDIEAIGERIFKAEQPRLALPDTSELDENRRSIATAQGTMDNVSSAAKSGSEIHIDDLNFDFSDVEDAKDTAIYNESLQTNAAFKTIQIIGQALRTYSGSIKGNLKVDLTRQCFELGLRTMAFNLQLHAAGKDIIHKSLVRFLELQSVRQKMHDEEKNALASRMFVNLVEFFVFTIIKHVAESVGSQRLMPVYEEIVQSLPTNSVRLIDFSIKLDHADYFPTREMESLALDLKKSHLFPYAILRRLVWQHLRLFRSDYVVRQKCANILDFPISRLVMLSAGSTVVADQSGPKTKQRKKKRHAGRKARRKR